MTPTDVLKLIQEKQVKFADLRFTDTRGKEQHVTIPARLVDEDLFRDGKMFDGSSIAGWKSINESDMILMPDAATAFIDPFFEESTVDIRCDVIEPATMQGYERDPRSLAKRAEAYLKSTGVADSALFGPENEFFIFDSVRYSSEINGSFYRIDSVQGAWNSEKDYDEGNRGHRPGVKGGYFPVPPVDAYQHNVAHGYGKTATFMPKPLVGDNGNGMHVHQSLQKEGRALFAGDKYGGLSDVALYYIGGIIKHAKALNAITNPGTNSYKRLVPGFEAPTLLAYSARNRSASIRIPWVSSPKARRIEVRFPDSCANPYFAFTAMMLAGLDGIQNKIHPGDPADKDLYDLEPEEAKHIPTVCHSLDMALEHLDKDREFLTRGGVFTNDVLDAYMALKLQEITRFRMSTHPVEMELYYSC